MMKNSMTHMETTESRPRFAVQLIVSCLITAFLTGCSTATPKPKSAEEKIHQRGWIGGEFKLARKTSLRLMPFGPREDFIGVFPPALGKTTRAGLFITALGTNAPAYE